MSLKNDDKFLFPRDQTEDFSFSQSKMNELIKSPHYVAKEIMLKDTAQQSQGLRIRLYPSGKAIYMVERRIRGEKGGAKKRKIGDVKEIKLDKARKKAGEYIAWMADGKDPKFEEALLKKKDRIYTVRYAYDLYITNRKIKDSTRERYKKQKEVLGFVHIPERCNWKDVEKDSDLVNTNRNKLHYSKLKSLLDADLNEISSQAILVIHQNITNNHGHGSNIAKTEGDRVIQFLGSLYDIAMDVVNENNEDKIYIKRNPVKIMSRGSGHWNNPGGKTKRKNEILDTSDIAAHYDAIMQLQDLRNKPDENDKTIKYVYKPIPGAVRAHYFLRFMFWTGWRPGDVARMQWNQVEEITEDGRSYTVVSWDDKEAQERLKNGEPIYRVPLNHQAAKVIQELREYRANKLAQAAHGEIKLRKDYDDKHVFLNVFENDHIKPNQHHYEKVVAELANISHYPTGIYRKTFLSYGNTSLGINVYTLKRLVFHTQNYFDVTSGYIHTHRQVLLDASEKIAEYMLSCVEGKKYDYSERSDELVDIKIDKSIAKEVDIQFSDFDTKYSDLIQIALSVKANHPEIFNKFYHTTDANAEFTEEDMSD